MTQTTFKPGDILVGTAAFSTMQTWSFYVVTRLTPKRVYVQYIEKDEQRLAPPGEPELCRSVTPSSPPRRGGTPSLCKLNGKYVQLGRNMLLDHWDGEPCVDQLLD